MFYVLTLKDQSGQVTHVVVNLFSGTATNRYLYDGFGKRTRSILPGNGGKYDYYYGRNGKLLGLTHYGSNNTLLSQKEFIWLGSMPVTR